MKPRIAANAGPSSSSQPRRRHPPGLAIKSWLTWLVHMLRLTGTIVLVGFLYLLSFGPVERVLPHEDGHAVAAVAGFWECFGAVGHGSANRHHALPGLGIARLPPGFLDAVR